MIGFSNSRGWMVQNERFFPLALSNCQREICLSLRGRGRPNPLLSWPLVSWPKSVAELGPLHSLERRAGLARRRVGYEEADDREAWAIKLQKDLEQFECENGLPSDFNVNSVPEIFRPLYQLSQKSDIELFLNQGSIDSLTQLFRLMRRFQAADSEPPLAEFTRLWWRYLPEQILDSELRKEINDSLDKCSLSLDWRLPGRLEDVRDAYLEVSSQEAEGRLATRYYLLDDQSLQEQLDELLKLQQRVAREWSLLDNLCCGGAFALASAFGRPIEPELAAEKCLESCVRSLEVEVKKIYKRLQQHKKVATLWQQALFFLSYVAPETALEILERYAASSLLPHIETLRCRLRGKNCVVAPLTNWIDDLTVL